MGGRFYRDAPDSVAVMEPMRAAASARKLSSAAFVAALGPRPGRPRRWGRVSNAGATVCCVPGRRCCKGAPDGSVHYEVDADDRDHLSIAGSQAKGLFSFSARYFKVFLR